MNKTILLPDDRMSPDDLIDALVSLACYCRRYGRYTERGEFAVSHDALGPDIYTISANSLMGLAKEVAGLSIGVES